MALFFCRNADKTSPITEFEPLTFSADGEIGGTEQVRVYLFNDDPTKYYERVSVYAVDLSGSDESFWVTVSVDVSGEPSAYMPVIELPNITDENVIPIWVKVNVPARVGTQKKSDLSLRCYSREYAV